MTGACARWSISPHDEQLMTIDQCDDALNRPAEYLLRLLDRRRLNRLGSGACGILDMGQRLVHCLVLAIVACVVQRCPIYPVLGQGVG